MDINKMTPAEKRVAVMRDVIAQVQVGRMQATSGVYVEGPIRFAPINQAALLKESAECRVCALGAAFISSVRLFNKFNGSYPGVSGMVDFLTMQELFSYEQLQTIEDLFEGFGSISWRLDTFDEQPAHDRMIGLCEAIIKLGGEFDRNSLRSELERVEMAKEAARLL